MHRLIWMAVLVCLFAAGCSGSKLLLVTPYSDSDPRTAEIRSGIEDIFRTERVPVIMTVFNMNTISHPTEYWRNAMLREAVTRLDLADPDMIFVAGDEAAQDFAVPLLSRPSHEKFIFLGLKGAPEKYGFTSAENVAGVGEVVPVREALDFMKRVVPNARGVVVLADKSRQGDAVVSQIMAADNLPIRVILPIRRVGTLGEWMTALRELQQMGDILCLASYDGLLKDGSTDETVPASEVLFRTAAENKLPDFSFWKEAVGRGGVMAAVTIPLKSQAKLAAEMALRNLYYSERLRTIGTETPAVYEEHVDYDRAMILDVALPADILQSAIMPAARIGAMGK